MSRPDPSQLTITHKYKAPLNQGGGTAGDGGCFFFARPTLTLTLQARRRASFLRVENHAKRSTPSLLRRQPPESGGLSRLGFDFWVMFSPSQEG